MKLTFYGAAKIVTGANYLLEAGGLKIIIDCGLYQGSRYQEELNFEPFAYTPSSVDFGFVSHSHMDHIGRFPKLYREGFHGPVYASEPTRAIMEIAYPDALDKMAAEAKELGHNPLYSAQDSHDFMHNVKGIRYGEKLRLNENVSAVLRDAGHILGSSMIEITVSENGREKKILFSGDVGNPPVPLLKTTEEVTDLDYLVLESAYGNRVHEQREERWPLLGKIVEETVSNGGVLMIPSFAIERTQELLYGIDGMIASGKIPKIPIFLDSPLAIKITRVYERYFHYFNQEAIRTLEKRGGLFRFDWLTVTPSTEESKKINDMPAPKIIIAGSGMSNGGRILHHELRYLSDPKSTILFVGYQVKGCLGRRILDGAQEVSIFGEKVPVRTNIRAIGGFSAHADQPRLLDFAVKANSGRGLKEVFTVQGEDEAAEALAAKIQEQTGATAVAPTANQSFDL